MSRREVTFDAPSWEAITLARIADAIDMQPVEVKHAGWPLGLLADGDGNAWRVSAAVAARPRTVSITRASIPDLRAELVRLFGTWVDLRHDGDDVLPGLDLAPVATITLPALSWPIVVDVAKAVRVLAATATPSSSSADSGMVLRRLEQGRALLRSDP